MNMNHEVKLTPHPNPVFEGWHIAHSKKWHDNDATGWRDFWWIPLYAAILIGVAVWAVALATGWMALM